MSIVRRLNVSYTSSPLPEEACGQGLLALFLLSWSKLSRTKGNGGVFEVHTPAAPRVLRFGAFEADLQSRELRKQGMQIKLQEQPFQILAFLLEHAGEIVTREQIRQRLWPTDTFVDVDNSVNAAVNRLREALGDSAESPRFVETVPRRGYRFIADVEEVLSNGNSTSNLRDRINNAYCWDMAISFSIHRRAATQDETSTGHAITLIHSAHGAALWTKASGRTLRSSGPRHKLREAGREVP